MDDWVDVPRRVVELAADPVRLLVEPADDLAGRIASASIRLRVDVDAALPEVPASHLPVCWDKCATTRASGALGAPRIPVDAFNRAVWQDAARGANPWGTRDALADGDTPMHTPMPVAAAVTGILEGAAVATGRRHVSPLQVAAVAGATAGKGWLAGLALGKTLGLLAGMPPESQDALQRAGLWGGALVGATRSLFGE